MLKEIDVLVTNKCDNHCSFCSFNAGHPMENEITKEEFFHIIDQAEMLGVEDIHLSGGEPTLREDLLEILAYAQTHFSGEIRMISNANHLTESYLQSIKQLGVNSLMLSLDGDQETHDRLRGNQGSYQRVMAASRYAIALGMTVRFSLVANLQNLHTIKGEIEKAAQAGVKLFSIFLMSPVGRAANMVNSLIPPDRWIQFCHDLRQWYLDHELDRSLNLIVEKGFQSKSSPLDVGGIHGRGIGCSYIGSNRKYIMIDPIGRIYPCVCFVGSDHLIGNIRTTPLKDIIENDDYWNFYLKLQDKVYPSCTGCTSMEICHSGCKGLLELGFAHTCNDTYYQVCPLMKESYQNNRIGGSSEEVM